MVIVRTHFGQRPQFSGRSGHLEADPQLIQRHTVPLRDPFDLAEPVRLAPVVQECHRSVLQHSSSRGACPRACPSVRRAASTGSGRARPPTQREPRRAQRGALVGLRPEAAHVLADVGLADDNVDTPAARRCVARALPMRRACSGAYLRIEPLHEDQVRYRCRARLAAKALERGVDESTPPEKKHPMPARKRAAATPSGMRTGTVRSSGRQR